MWTLGVAAAAGCADGTAPVQRSTPDVLDPKGDGASIIAGEMWIQFAVGAGIFLLVVGAFIIIGLENYLSGFGEWVTVITGLIFVVCVLAFRRGIVGELSAWWSKRAG